MSLCRSISIGTIEDRLRSEESVTRNIEKVGSFILMGQKSEAISVLSHGFKGAPVTQHNSQ